MARGWESKSIESQIEDAQSNRRDAARRQMSPGEAEKNRRRESLLLSRTRVLRDLEATRNPRYRETLSEALKYLDQKLTDLE
jgi:hypothetical protein